MLAWLLRELSRYGVNDVVLLSEGGPIAAALPQIVAGLPVPMHIAVSPAPAALPLLQDRFLLAHGNRLLDGNLARLFAAAAQDGPEVAVRSARTGAGDGAIHLVRRSALAQAPDEATFESAILPGLAVRETRLNGESFETATPAGLARAQAVLPQRLHRKVLFLDRDGVINVDHGYVGSRDRFEWTATALDAIRCASEAGWHVFVVTNQSGVARGRYGEADVVALLDWMRGEVLAAGGTIDDWRYCPHHPEAQVAQYRQDCDCRKPSPGMLLGLLRAWGADPARCVLIGDQPTDLQAAAAANVRAFRFDGGDLSQFAGKILRGQTAPLPCP